MALVGRNPFAGRFERAHLTKEFNDSAAAVADSGFFGGVTNEIEPGGVASTAVAGGVGLTRGTPGTLTPGGVGQTSTLGGVLLTRGTPWSITPGGVPSSETAGGAALSVPVVLEPGGVPSSEDAGGVTLTPGTPGEITPGGVPSTAVAGGVIPTLLGPPPATPIYPGGVPSASAAGSIVLTGEVEPRVPGNFYERWSSGVHIGATRPTMRVMMRSARFWRRNANWHGPPMDVTIHGGVPNNRPWQGFWTPYGAAKQYREILNVREIRFEQSLDQNGITSATISIENIYYQPEAEGHHSIKRGYMSPLRGYVAPGQTPIEDEQGEMLTQNEWYALLGRESQITIYQGYGDSEIKAFTGLIDDIDTTSRPDVITLTARDFGKALTDEHVFGWNKDPKIRDPVIFVDGDQADDISLVGTDAVASSDRPGHLPDNVLDGDGDTTWWSDWHTTQDVTEYVQIRLPEGRYEDYYLNLGQAHDDVYVSLYAKKLSDDSPPTLNGNPIADDGWQGSGDVPGDFGGIPYIVHLTNVLDGGHVRSLSGDEYRLGKDSILRISLRTLPLMAIDPGRFGATVVQLRGRRRKLKQEAKEQKWVRVGDTSDVVRQILRWAGFKEWEVERSGVRLSKRFVTNRGMTYMDVIQRMKDVLGFTFFMGDPTKAPNSIGFPVFRRSLIATNAAPVVTVDDNSLLNAVEIKRSDEALAYIIRVRGRESANGQRLGAEAEKRIMYVFRPPWSFQLGTHTIDKLGGIIKHLIYEDKMFKTKDDVKFGAYYIALQEALAASQATLQIAGNPGPQLDDHVAVLDLGTGVTSRVSVQTRSSTFTIAADQSQWALTLGGALVDEPDVSRMVAIIEKARRA